MNRRITPVNERVVGTAWFVCSEWEKSLFNSRQLIDCSVLTVRRSQHHRSWNKGRGGSSIGNLLTADSRAVVDYFLISALSLAANQFASNTLCWLSTVTCTVAGGRGDSSASASSFGTNVPSSSKYGQLIAANRLLSRHWPSLNSISSRSSVQTLESVHFTWMVLPTTEGHHYHSKLPISKSDQHRSLVQPGKTECSLAECPSSSSSFFFLKNNIV